MLAVIFINLEFLRFCLRVLKSVHLQLLLVRVIVVIDILFLVYFTNHLEAINKKLDKVNSWNFNVGAFMILVGVQNIYSLVKFDEIEALLLISWDFRREISMDFSWKSNSRHFNSRAVLSLRFRTHSTKSCRTNDESFEPSSQKFDQGSELLLWRNSENCFTTFWLGMLTEKSRILYFAG